MTDTVNVYEKSRQEGVSLDNIKTVVEELVGEEAVPVVSYLKGKSHISEFILAEELEMEIHDTRRVLYKLLENNVVSFKRKKDKIKGWYICYWDLNEKAIPQLLEKINNDKLEKMKERLEKEQNNNFYICSNACMRMNFEKAMEFGFKCVECGQIMEEQDNSRTIEVIKERIEELENAS